MTDDSALKTAFSKHRGKLKLEKEYIVDDQRLS